MRYSFFAAALLALSAACTAPRSLSAPAPRSVGQRAEQLLDTSAIFQNSLTGFCVLDLESGQVLAQRQANHYFTPASNAKILTLAACLAVLGDSLPTLEYAQLEDGYVFRGHSDPTFLHDQFAHWQKGWEWMRQLPKGSRFTYVQRPLEGERFGRGWAWDDYADDYQTERNTLPLYGNCFMVNYDPILGKNRATPRYFEREQGFTSLRRSEYSNYWNLPDNKRAEQERIPFRTDPELVTALLRDTLAGQFIYYHPELEQEVNRGLMLPWRTLYSAPTDTVLRWMMQVSDNHFAEQLLLMAATQKMGIANQDSIIRFAVGQLFPPSAQKPRWVDGSGLSRYNLVTPLYLCHLLQQMHQRYDPSRLHALFPAGGQSGTIQEWYAGKDGQPYVFAKTGSMSGVYCISGYLKTRSGKWLAFSIMNNHFVGSNRPWRTEIQRILEILAEY